jgi:hypothetical protein
MDSRLETWSKDFLEDILAEANAVEDGEFRSNVFFRHAAEIMVDAGDCVDPIPCQYGGRGVKVSGYDYEEDSDSIDLFVVGFDATSAVRTIGRNQVTTALDRLGHFLGDAMKGAGNRLEESAEVFGLAQLINDTNSSLKRARLLFVTNGLVKPFDIPEREINGVECSFGGLGH